MHGKRPIRTSLGSEPYGSALECTGPKTHNINMHISRYNQRVHAIYSFSHNKKDVFLESKVIVPNSMSQFTRLLLALKVT